MSYAYLEDVFVVDLLRVRCSLQYLLAGDVVD